ncbi:hypothetical protein [Staphylococcus sp. ZWU0021]|uniref:hypothetical protein n=1 Tax=Staphylococcus sp. ZWU0021 TaxID=1339238 RepID=UPI001E49B638|nr:hypothetical protein [Staphylococcus sp. ZWU0021]
MMEYKISKYDYDYSGPGMTIILVCLKDPRKRKYIKISKYEFNADDYKIGDKYKIRKFLWLEIWTKIY